MIKYHKQDLLQKYSFYYFRLQDIERRWILLIFLLCINNETNHSSNSYNNHYHNHSDDDSSWFLSTIATSIIATIISALISLFFESNKALFIINNLTLRIRIITVSFIFLQPLIAIERLTTNEVLFAFI